jgi:hypothetical protein
MDSSEAAQSAFVFVTDWARSFDAEVWFIQLAAESPQRHCGVATDVQHRGRRTANSFTVSGATRRARTRQLVHTVAEAAATYRADVLVLGFDSHRMTQGSLTRTLREQLYEETNIPVLVAPSRQGPRAVEVLAPLPAIALGPAPDREADLIKKLTHV